MAKITDTDLMWFGSKFNAKQMRLAIPGGPTANTGGISFLECIDSSGDAQGGLYLFTDGTSLRYSTSVPTNTNSDGYALDATATSSMVNKQLANLATVAINTSIQSDTDLTDDCGDASYQWLSLYARDLYLNSTATMKGTSAGQIDVVGKFYVGTNSGASAYDVNFYGYTAGQFLQWDENAYSNAGGLLLKDNVRLGIGAATSATGDIFMYGDGDNMVIEAATDDVVIKSGYSTHVDWTWYSKNSTNDMGWIADSKTLQLSGSALLSLGGAAILTADDGFYFAWDDDATLNLDPYNANDVFRIGETTIADFYLDGNAYDIGWDASVDELVFDDGAKLVFGGSAGAGTDDLIIASGGDVVNFTFGATTNGIIVQSYASQTVAALDLDNDTAEWAGANDIGLFHIRSDAALGNAGASLFYIDNSGKPIASAEGFMARWIDGSTNTSGTYAVEMFSNANHILHMHTGAVGVTPLTIAPHTNATASAIAVDCYTDGFVGAANTGLVNINAKGTLAATTASLLHINPTGAYYAAGAGGALFINDDKTASGTNYSAYIISAAVNCMKLETETTTMTALTLLCKANATAASLLVDGDTAGFLGASNIGLVTIQNDIALTDVASSALVIDVGATAPIDAAAGYCFRIIDTSTVATSNNSYAAYIDATANHGMAIETRAAAARNLVLVGVAAQAASMLYVDGTTGAGWEGAANIGQVHIKNDAAFDDQGSALYIDLAEAPTAASEGAGIHVIQSAGSACTDGYLVNIEAVATGGGLHVDGGYSTFDEKVTFIAGQQSTPVARTAETVPGAGTSTIGVGENNLTVTSAAADDVIVLPTPVLGDVIMMKATASTDFEVQPHANTAFINGTECTGTPPKEIIVTAEDVTFAICTKAGATGTWVTFSVTSAGVVTNGVTPD